MLDVIEEAKREELKAKCREMKVLPPTDIFIGLQVHDKGKLIFDDVQRGHSWTRNYWNAIFAYVSNCSIVDSSFGAGYISCKNPAGAFTYQANTLLIQGLIMAGSANITNGIVVGTGTSAFDVEQYALDALIGSGNSAGKLYYNASAVSSTTYAAKAWTIVGSRIFNNNSGGSIVVAETGLYSAQGWSIYWLFERSVLGAAVTVPDAAQLTVTYTIVDDFSAID
jgi:hypothetical protein